MPGGLPLTDGILLSDGLNIGFSRKKNSAKQILVVAVETANFFVVVESSVDFENSVDFGSSVVVGSSADFGNTVDSGRSAVIADFGSSAVDSGFVVVVAVAVGF